MKKLIMCLSLLFLSLKSFSQNDTLVRLPAPLAKLVITDLLEGDVAKLQLLEYKELVRKLEEKSIIQNNVNTNLEKQIINLNSIIENQTSQSVLRDKAIGNLEDELRKQSRQKKLYKVGTSIGAAAVLLLLIQ